MGFDAKYAELPGAIVGPTAVLEGGVCLGTVSLADLGIDDQEFESPRKRRKRRAEEDRQSHSEKTKQRLELERQGTTELVTQLRLSGIPEPRSLLHPEGQVRFHPKRRWRFDLAWPDILLAAELQGFGHSNPKCLGIDCEKACEAAGLGWTLLPMLYKHIRNGKALAWIEQNYRLLEAAKSKG